MHLKSFLLLPFITFPFLFINLFFSTAHKSHYRLQLTNTLSDYNCSTATLFPYDIRHTCKFQKPI